MSVKSRMKLRIDALQAIDPLKFEAAAEDFIVQVDSRELAGSEKKALVVRKLKLWADEQLKFKGIWEWLSDIAIDIVLFFLSGWVESVFLRWKAKKQSPAVSIAPSPVAPPPVAEPVRGRQSKKKEDEK